MSDTTGQTKTRRRTTSTKAAAAPKPAKAAPAAKPPSKTASAAKPTAKTASKSTTAPKSGTKTARRTKPTTASPVTAEKRYQMITEAAYLIAEKHGFDSGRDIENWLEAEAQIDSILSGDTKH